MVRHPAAFSDALLPIMAGMLAAAGARRVLDPFLGTGKLHLLRRWAPDLETAGIEIEREWAELAATRGGAVQGNALRLPFADGSFDAICTSPCYGNRMADHHQARDASRRHTYTHCLGRPLHPDNAGAMQWGDGYRALHRAIWAECRRVVRPGGVFILNVKDHIRAGVRQAVTQWHTDLLGELGLTIVEREEIPCPGQRHGQNGAARVPTEAVILFERRA